MWTKRIFKESKYSKTFERLIPFEIQWRNEENFVSFVFYLAAFLNQVNKQIKNITTEVPTLTCKEVSPLMCFWTNAFSYI